MKVIDSLKKLPGVGSRSAERYAFDLLGWPVEELSDFARVIQDIPRKITHCKTCGCLADQGECSFCNNPARDSGLFCLVSSAREVFVVEESGEFGGLYHVLGGTLNPMEGRGPELLNIPALRRRLEEHEARELVIALDATLEGDATALLLKRELRELPLKISRIAFGIPMGSALEYADGGTLARALVGRMQF